MSRYERSQYLDTLCSLRTWYLSAPSDDRRGTLAIEDAIAYAESVMDALEAERRDLPADSMPAAGDRSSGSRDPRD